MMLIRTEAPVDQLHIDSLIAEYAGQSQQQMFHQLRESGELALSVVLVDDDGELHGHVAALSVWCEDFPRAVLVSLVAESIEQQSALCIELAEMLMELGYGALCARHQDGQYYQWQDQQWQLMQADFEVSEQGMDALAHFQLPTLVKMEKSS
ncbi:hypothetical protein VST7929_02240 [Vibrio stylophorae]|uniref:N-acetyltransferase domain-containing protein n=1 Tax=Vibrio stylophorae TaxID=659351 RepID=A0ABN8DU68_9VIBR|nr:hypothetical protein [Vibrio stylophorae]CAH0534317.1 hypothetical protein VST7929_02240 [Vibrio stylophorae]